MPDVKRKEEKQVYPAEKLPVNYYEFFEKKAEQARIFLEKHPFPEDLFTKKD